MVCMPIRVSMAGSSNFFIGFLFIVTVDTMVSIADMVSVAAIVAMVSIVIREL